MDYSPQGRTESDTTEATSQQQQLPAVEWSVLVGRGYVPVCDTLDAASQVASVCPTLWDPVDRSPPGSCVHGILQARILEWVAMPSSSGSSQPRDGTGVSCVSCTGRQVLHH